MNLNELKHSKNDSPQKIVESIRKHGIVLVDNYVDNLKELKKEVDKILEQVQDDGSYKFGKASRIGSAIEQYSTSPEICSVFTSNWMSEITNLYLGIPNRFNHDIFITHDYRNDQGVETNGFFHWDKLHTFKFFIYLTDVNSEDDGAFTVIPGSHLQNSILRQKEWSGKTYQQVESVKCKLHEFPQLNKIEKDMIPILGKAGQLIIFDTDIWHKGGNVSSGKERKIIRGHCRKV